MSVAGSIDSGSPSVLNVAGASITAPFGLTKDPSSLKGTVYASPITLVNSAIYSASPKIFSFKSIGQENVVDNATKLWSALHRKNAHGDVPKVTSFEVRSGASNAILGYLQAAKDSNQTYPVLTTGASLPYLKPTLSSHGSQLPLSFHVPALDYDSESNALVSNYVTPLTVANDLNYAVFTPLSPKESQHLALLSLVYSQVQTNINLFDGPTYLKENLRIDDVLGSEDLKSVHSKLSTAVDSWKSFKPSQRPTAALQTLNSIIGTDYKPFEYFGHKDATTVFVVYGSVESELFAKELEEYSAKHFQIGVIAARIPLPFDSEEFLKTIPQSAQSLIVISQSLNNKSSVLKSNVAATVFLNGLFKTLKVSEFIYAPTFVWSPIAVAQIIGSFIVLPKKQPDVSAKIGSATPYGDFIFWSLDNGKFVDVASKLAHAFSLDSGSIVKFRSKFDNTVSGGIYQAQLSSTKNDAKLVKPNVGAIDSADLIVVENIELLKTLNVVKTVKAQGYIIVALEETPADLPSFVESLPVQFRRNIANNENKLVFIDLATIGEVAATKGRTGLIAIQSVFWKYAAPQLNINDIVRRVLHASGSDIELLPAVLTQIIEETVFAKGIKEVVFDPKWSELPLEENEVVLPIFPTESSFEPNPRSIPEAPVPEVSTFVDIAKRFAFQESYGSVNNLRPDLPVRNFVVKVQENRRVTPNDYSRNIFHIEFDITGTGLTYDIGEALGVHGRNNPEEVEAFLKFYGLDPEALIQVPNKDYPELTETRTVFQAFTDNLDLLGKPPKRFYESLAAFATDDAEKKKLELLGSAEGVVELKRFQDEEFYSYSDILELFPSAKPSLEDLVTLIPPLKRREYSIASSQKIHPNAVHLLIVVVDWVDNRKRKRYGQCSRFLSQLAIGSELVVSVKPSVMKLPPLSTQPIVMSGLGTGLAPFKAFVEEKIWQKQQGMEIGEVYLYLGARHRKEEYLYGELWEAYKAAGIITYIGAAFSRDQPEKVYIQDKIRENLDELKELIVKKNGSFYLCGPTWPVPSITEALVSVVEAEARERGVEIDGEREVEEMKENSRYILEVY